MTNLDDRDVQGACTCLCDTSLSLDPHIFNQTIIIYVFTNSRRRALVYIRSVSEAFGKGV